jgi:hypothetical protein
MMWASSLFMTKGPHPLSCAGSQATYGEVTIIVMFNCLNYCVICILYTSFVNIAVGRVEDPCCVVFTAHKHKP